VQLYIKEDDGSVVATYIDGNLYAHPRLNRRMLAFELFNLMIAMAGVGNGMGFENSVDKSGDAEDVDGGTP